MAVLHPITKGLKAAGNQVVGIIGARTKDLLILEDEDGPRPPTSCGSAPTTGRTAITGS